jgi:putative ABC transport system permease protein
LQVATIIVRTTQPGLVIPTLRTVPKEADPNVLVELSSMQQLVDQSVSGRRFSMTVLTAFSALALFLAAVGIYGVLAYTVAQRQREIGVRMALGSTRTGVRAMVLGDALRAVLPGVAIGLIGAFFTTRLIESMLYGVTPLDPITFIVTPMTILAVAVAASLWPATRAARVDPMLAMRAE